LGLLLFIEMGSFAVLLLLAAKHLRRKEGSGKVGDGGSGERGGGRGRRIGEGYEIEAENGIRERGVAAEGMVVRWKEGGVWMDVWEWDMRFI
jgi:hypothetical protein